MRQRMSTGELCMSFAEFRASDFGQLCQHLGLRPSQPHRDALGKEHRRRRRKARSKPSG